MNKKISARVGKLVKFSSPLDSAIHVQTAMVHFIIGKSIEDGETSWVGSRG